MMSKPCPAPILDAPTPSTRRLRGPSSTFRSPRRSDLPTIQMREARGSGSPSIRGRDRRHDADALTRATLFHLGRAGAVPVTTATRCVWAIHSACHRLLIHLGLRLPSVAGAGCSLYLGRYWPIESARHTNDLSPATYLGRRQ